MGFCFLYKREMIGWKSRVAWYNVDGDMMNGKWIVAVSGGSDSMALLDQCIQAKIDVIAAHVNYQKRETAKRDMDYVKAYCQEHGIPFFVKYSHFEGKGNFQAYAREFRYDFFKELAVKHHCEGVLVAHQLDDLIETYLIQQERKQVPMVYGLANKTTINGLKIVRPLLAMSKAACREYCIEHQVPFGDDESNFSDDYTRNRIRHQIVEKMSLVEKQSMAQEIHQLNEKKMLADQKAHAAAVLAGDYLAVCELMAMEDRESVLRAWLLLQEGGKNHSHAFIQQLFQLMHKPKNWCADLPNHKRLYCDYGKLNVVDETLSYSYTFDEFTPIQTPFFTMAKEGNSLQAVSVTEKDWPITVRSPLPSDEISLRLGTKKLNRWFIDRKISHKERKCWPVVVNVVGKVILVPEIGCEVAHFTNKPNVFVIK